MRRDDIVQLIHAAPFQPFRITITNGESFEIRHPEMLGVTNGALYITLKGLIDNEAELDNSVNSIIVSLVHVVKIERLQFKQPLPNTTQNTGA